MHKFKSYVTVRCDPVKSLWRPQQTPANIYSLTSTGHLHMFSSHRPTFVSERVVFGVWLRTHASLNVTLGHRWVKAVWVKGRAGALTWRSIASKQLEPFVRLFTIYSRFSSLILLFLPVHTTQMLTAEAKPIFMTADTVEKELLFVLMTALCYEKAQRSQNCILKHIWNVKINFIICSASFLLR